MFPEGLERREKEVGVGGVVDQDENFPSDGQGDEPLVVAGGAVIGLDAQAVLPRA